MLYDAYQLSYLTHTKTYLLKKNNHDQEKMTAISRKTKNNLVLCLK